MYEHILWLAPLAIPALAQNPLFEVRGAPGESLGWEVRALDDRDGDGLPEIAAAFAPTSGSYRVLRGSDGSVLTDILGTPVGDVDGDGQDDRLVYLAADELGVASGDAGPLLWSVSFNLNGAPGMSAFPYDIGDVDGDSKDDLLVNESWWGNTYVSQFSVYSGLDGAVIHRRILQGAFAWPWAVPVGDLDGDQASEIALADAGVLHILRADGSELASWIPPSEVLFPFNSTALFSGGFRGADADGDGLADLGFSVFEAALTIFSNPIEEPLTMIASALDGRPIYQAEGVAGSLQGDLDADGKVDLAIWNDAAFEVHSPATGMILRQVRPTTQGWPWFPGPTVLGPELFSPPTFGAIIGDLDGDGLGELIVGEDYPAASLAPMGRVRVFTADWSDEIGTRLLPPATACPCRNGRRRDWLSELDRAGVEPGRSRLALHGRSALGARRHRRPTAFHRRALRGDRSDKSQTVRLGGQALERPLPSRVHAHRPEPEPVPLVGHARLAVGAGHVGSR